MDFCSYAKKFSDSHAKKWNKKTLYTFLQNAPPLDGHLDEIALSAILAQFLTMHIIYLLNHTKTKVNSSIVQHDKKFLLDEINHIIDQDIDDQKKALTKL